MRDLKEGNATRVDAPTPADRRKNNTYSNRKIPHKCALDKELNCSNSRKFNCHTNEFLCPYCTLPESNENPLTVKAREILDLWRNSTELDPQDCFFPPGLEKYSVRHTEQGITAGVYDGQSPYPSNLLFFLNSRAHQLHSSLVFGHYIPCNCYFDAVRLVATPDYIDGLVLARRFLGAAEVTHVVATITPENIAPVIQMFRDRWPNIEFVAAPRMNDSVWVEDVTIMQPTPPQSIETWAQLREWGAAWMA